MKRERLLVVFKTKNEALAFFNKQAKTAQASRARWLWFCTSTSDVRVVSRDKLGRALIYGDAPLFTRVEFRGYLPDHNDKYQARSLVVNGAVIGATYKCKNENKIVSHALEIVWHEKPVLTEHTIDAAQMQKRHKSRSVSLWQDF